MGRKSVKKDRGYITKTEWATEWGGYKAQGKVPFKQLPFFCCAIAFTPFEDPACTLDGTVYDLTNILPYIRKFHKHPVTGEPLERKDIVRLNYAKNAEGEYHCPVLNKVFTAHTHIVAIRSTGNVYCWEAVEELNIKRKYWKDLLTDEPFTRKDIIHLQDPLNLQGKNVVEFDHVKHDLSIEDEAELEQQRKDPMYSLKKEGLSEDTQRIMDKMNTPAAIEAFERGGGGARAQAERALADEQAQARARAKEAKDAKAKEGSAEAARVQAGGKDPRLQPPEPVEKTALFKPGASTWNTDDPTQAPYWVRAKMEKEIEAGSWRGKQQEEAKPSGNRVAPLAVPQYKEDTMRTTGVASRSFTSSAVAVHTKNQRQQVRVERHPKKKGYMRLHTSLGDLNLELHCDLAPRTCENFFVLAEAGYYTGTIFHRSIKNFMIQGGDPTGTGTGGESIYGGNFKDEVDSRLLHSGRGVLSMANSGPNTNGSQFFILYKSAHHLDYKHSVFGRVVGGLEVLTAMERVPVNDDDRPLEDVKITGSTVFVNPFKEEEEAERKKEEEERLKAEKEALAPSQDESVGAWFSNPGLEQARAASGSGVGRYLSVPKSVPPTASIAAPQNGAAPQPPAKKRKQATGFTNFDAW